MPKYNVSVEFNLDTSVEFEGYIEGVINAEDVTVASDDSYFSSEEISSSGGDVHLVIEADDENEAEDKAREAISDGNEIEDNNGLTWVFVDVNYSVELAEMDRDTAIGIIARLLERLLGQGVLNEDEKQAFEVILKG